MGVIVVWLITLLFLEVKALRRPLERVCKCYNEGFTSGSTRTRLKAEHALFRPVTAAFVIPLEGSV